MQDPICPTAHPTRLHKAGYHSILVTQGDDCCSVKNASREQKVSNRLPHFEIELLQKQVKNGLSIVEKPLALRTPKEKIYKTTTDGTTRKLL
jgi:hypothetical protein